MTRIRNIRVYRCANPATKCGTTIHDHAEPGGRFQDVINCPKCRKPMSHTTAPYSVSTPDPLHPQRRVAVRLPA